MHLLQILIRTRKCKSKLLERIGKESFGPQMTEVLTRAIAHTVRRKGNFETFLRLAVLDSGIDYYHPDLAGNYKGGYDFVDNDYYPRDLNGHGTHVAGIIAARDNDYGVIGVAPKASLYAVRVLDAQGDGDMDDVAAGINWAINNNMDIITMSLTGPDMIGGPRVSRDQAINRRAQIGIIGARKRK